MVRIVGPSSVIAIVCSKCADRIPSAVTTVQPSSSDRRRRRRRVDHRLDREHHARSRAACPGRPARSSGPRDPRASRCRCRGRRTRARPRSPRLRATSSTAAPTSPSRFPATVAAIADIERRLGSRRCSRCDSVVDLADRHRDRGVGVPALDDRTAVDRDDVAVLEHAAPGDAVHDHLVRRDADDRRESRGSRGSSSGRRAGRARRARPRSRSAVVAPGTAARVHASCISATTRPARAHQRDLVGGLTENHRRRSRLRELLDAASTNALEDLVALADAVDDGRAGPLSR